MASLFRIAFVIIMFSPASAFGADRDSILGVWTTQGGDSKIDLFTCGQKICGKIIWLKAPTFQDSENGPVGKTKTDRRNPDKKLRSRPIIGLQVINNLVPKGNNSWEQGNCYDPESGKTYRCKMKLVSPNKLDLRGYIGFSLLGRTFSLTR